MFRAFKGISRKVGLAPGTAVYTGERKAEETNITVTDFDQENYSEKKATSVEECFPYRDSPSTTWINVDGLHDVAVIERLGSHFGLHPLVVEDIVHTEQRPKVEIFDDYIYVVLKMHYYGPDHESVDMEQISIVLSGKYVITLQERRGDVFSHVRGRIRENAGRIRKSGTDYIAYALMDAVVDNYFVILEKEGECIDVINDALLTGPEADTLNAIRLLKARMTMLRRSVWPLRELIGGLERGDSPLIKAETRVYLRDLYDHTIQVIETVETFRETIAGMFDLYLSSMSNRMNETMKLLTIFAAIFIPITFIAGVYGMNFDYMPELKWQWGYFGALSIMAFAAIAMLAYFRKKRWL